LIGQGEGPAPPEEEGQSGFPLGADREEREAYLQKRMVDFVKRRVLVLEKVLNAEYHSTVCDTKAYFFPDTEWPDGHNFFDMVLNRGENEKYGS